MSDEQLSEKLAQFNEFFSIKHTFNINIAPLNNAHVTYEDFLSLMPAPFKLANDIITLDQAALAPLQALSGVAGQLVQYLNHQAQKIDLLVGHIISEQDSIENRSDGVAFGGGGIEFSHNTSFNQGDIVELKIFLSHENCAIYCHGEIISSENQNDSSDNYLHKVIFHHIREEDREILVRASLHIQSRQLQQLAKERNKK